MVVMETLSRLGVLDDMLDRETKVHDAKKAKINELICQLTPLLFEQRLWGLYELTDSMRDQMSYCLMDQDYTYAGILLHNMLTQGRVKDTLKKNTFYVPFPIVHNDTVEGVKQATMWCVYHNRLPLYFDFGDAPIDQVTTQDVKGIYSIDSLIVDDHGLNLVIDTNVLTLLNPDSNLFRSLAGSRSKLHFSRPNMIFEYDLFSPKQLALPYREKDFKADSDYH